MAGVNIDGLVQEKRNSSALAMELRPSCTYPSIFTLNIHGLVQERLNSSSLAMEFRLSCTNPSIFTVRILRYNVSYICFSR